MKNQKVAFVFFNTLNERCNKFWGSAEVSRWSGFLKKLGIENDILLILLYPGKKLKNTKTIHRFIEYCKKYDLIFLRARWSMEVGEIIEIELGEKIHYMKSEAGKRKLESLVGSQGGEFGKTFCPNFKYIFFGTEKPLPQKIADVGFSRNYCSASGGIEDNYFYKNLDRENKKNWKGCSYCASALNYNYTQVTRNQKVKELSEQILYLCKELPELEMVSLPFPENHFDILPELFSIKKIRPISFHIQLRPDVLVEKRNKLMRILKLMRNNKFSFFISNMGFENFSQRELDILNRGYNADIIADSLKMYSFFKDKYPDVWHTKETIASFIMFEPFTNLQDIIINVNQILSLKKYFGLFAGLNFNKLRINKDTPIYYLTKKVGLISRYVSSDDLLNLPCGGYSENNIGYQFKDLKMNSVYRFYNKLLFSIEKPITDVFFPIRCLDRSWRFVLKSQKDKT